MKKWATGGILPKSVSRKLGCFSTGDGCIMSKELVDILLKAANQK